MSGGVDSESVGEGQPQHSELAASITKEVGKGPIGEMVSLAYFRLVKYINKRCLAIAGAGVLFLGFSGSAQANPFSMSQHLGKGISLFSHNGHDDIGSYGSLTQSDDRESFYHQTALTQFDGGLADKAGQNRNTLVPEGQEEVAVMCTLPKAVIEPNSTSNVPDGGATAVMVGASMIGLAFMRKKQAA